MQGLWKSELNGWKKDSKRKKCNRKHFIKDKINLIQKDVLNYYSNKDSKFMNEDKLIFQSKQLNKALFNSNKFIYYGSWSEKVFLNRTFVKQKLKQNIYDFKFEKKYIRQYG